MLLRALTLHAPRLTGGAEDIVKLEEQYGAERGQRVHMLSLTTTLACRVSRFPTATFS